MRFRLTLSHICCAALVVIGQGGVHAATAAASKPNVVLILTDDQGYGELGATGNPVVHTPRIDAFAKQSVTLTHFNVMAVCSPTRATLMTGRYYYRTGLTDTFLGCSLMDPAETTLAQMLAGGGYHTGIFGKWHLGDNYPRRPEDKGFEEALVLNGGGLAQPGDPPDSQDERGAYFNATLRHNGKWEKTPGYVSDVITHAAIQFIERNRQQPFFVYLAFNCPHAPHQVPASYRERYPAKDFDPKNFPAGGHPMSTEYKPEDLARVYGMIENIDDNVGRVLARLQELGLSDNTIVVLLSDNGCQHHNGYNAGFQGWKASPYEGGIHQFCFIRWPRELAAGRAVDRLAAVFDLAPTLLDLCAVPKPAAVHFDGRSLAPLLRGEPVDWPDRTLVFQYHRGAVPERYRSFAVRNQDWKLVQPLGDGFAWNGKTEFQLYDLASDPLELHDVAAQFPERVAALKHAYDAWFDDIVGGRDFKHPQRLYIGTPHENPVLLTRQDWRGERARPGPNAAGGWDLNVTTAGRYDIKLRFDSANVISEAQLNCCGVSVRESVDPGSKVCVFKNVRLPAGLGRLDATIQEGRVTRGVNYVEVTRLATE